MSRVVHFEILTDAPESLASFYKEALGWNIQSAEGPQKYWLATTGEEGVPGINGGLMERHFDQPVINTVQIESMEQSIEKVNATGGTLQHGPNEIPGVGLHAYCADPAGNLFGLLQPASAPETSSDES